jgi:DNA-binding XRE family transcriptional regulator
MRTRLKIFRVKQRLNQHEMAATLGYERAYYGHIERGYMAGSAEFWARLQKRYALTDDEVKGLQEID